MLRYEYKVVPAPKRGEKARGVKSTEDRFAFALTHLMNDLGREGWDYLRADTLPCDERVGLTGSKTTFQNMLVFRRPLDVAVDVADQTPAFSTLRTPVDAAAGEPLSPGLKLGPAQGEGGQPRPIGPAQHGLAAE